MSLLLFQYSPVVIRVSSCSSSGQSQCALRPKHAVYFFEDTNCRTMETPLCRWILLLFLLCIAGRPAHGIMDYTMSFVLFYLFLLEIARRNTFVGCVLLIFKSPSIFPCCLFSFATLACRLLHSPLLDVSC